MFGLESETKGAKSVPVAWQTSVESAGTVNQEVSQQNRFVLKENVILSSKWLLWEDNVEIEETCLTRKVKYLLSYLSIFLL